MFIYRHGRFSYVDTTPTTRLKYWGRYPLLHVPLPPLRVGNFSAVDLRQSATLGTIWDTFTCRCSWQRVGRVSPIWPNGAPGRPLARVAFSFGSIFSAWRGFVPSWRTVS